MSALSSKVPSDVENALAGLGIDAANVDSKPVLPLPNAPLGTGGAETGGAVAGAAVGMTGAGPEYTSPTSFGKAVVAAESPARATCEYMKSGAPARIPPPGSASCARYTVTCTTVWISMPGGTGQPVGWVASGPW